MDSQHDKLHQHLQLPTSLILHTMKQGIKNTIHLHIRHYHQFQLISNMGIFGGNLIDFPL